MAKAFGLKLYGHKLWGVFREGVPATAKTYVPAIESIESIEDAVPTRDLLMALTSTRLAQRAGIDSGLGGILQRPEKHSMTAVIQYHIQLTFQRFCSREKLRMNHLRLSQSMVRLQSQLPTVILTRDKPVRYWTRRRMIVLVCCAGVVLVLCWRCRRANQRMV